LAAGVVVVVGGGCGGIVRFAFGWVIEVRLGWSASIGGNRVVRASDLVEGTTKSRPRNGAAPVQIRRTKHEDRVAFAFAFELDTKRDR